MFDVKKHLIKVQGGRQYLPVAARLVWFRQEHPDWGIETRAVTIDTEKQYAVFEARVYNAEGKLMATGTKMENVKGFPDFIEKAETGSIGRALAVCGYGTQFAPDLDETTGGHGAPRIVDSPQPMGGRPAAQSSYGGSSYRSSRSMYAGQSRYGSDSQPGAYAGVQGDDGFASQRNPIEDGDSRNSDSRNGEQAHTTAKPDSHGLKTAGDLLAERNSQRAGEENDLFDAPAKADQTAGVSDPNSCSACGKALNSAQQTLSVRKYGVALCPTCQKERRAVEA